MASNSILHESKRIEWSIKNFFDEPVEDNYKLDSPCVFLSGAKWFLRLYTNGETRNRTLGYVSLYLIRKNNTTSKHKVLCRFGFLKKDRTEFEVNETKHTFTKEANGYGYIKCLKRSQLLRHKKYWAPGNTLTIFCTFRIMDGPKLLSGKSLLIKDFQDMYSSGFQSDLIITVQNKEFRAHRCILASRSPVFKSMLSHDMMEKNNGRVEIRDGDPDTFENFLIFLYTGTVDIVSSRNAVSLYCAADKYDVKELKDKCVRFMFKNLSDDSFCDIFHLAMIHDEKNLLKDAKDYFIRNAATIVITEEWHALLAEQPLVANDLFFEKLASTNDVKIIEGPQYLLHFCSASILFITSLLLFVWKYIFN